MRALLIATVFFGTTAVALAQRSTALAAAPTGGSAAAVRDSLRGTYRIMDAAVGRMTPRMRAHLARTRPDLRQRNLKTEAVVFGDRVAHTITEQRRNQSGFPHDVATIELQQAGEQLGSGLYATRPSSNRSERGRFFNVFAPLGATHATLEETWLPMAEAFDAPYRRSTLVGRTETFRPGSDDLLVEKLVVTGAESREGVPSLGVRYAARTHASSGAPLGPERRLTLTISNQDGRFGKEVKDLIWRSGRSNDGAADRGYYGLLSELRAAAAESRADQGPTRTK
jgi:hypothetical protein